MRSSSQLSVAACVDCYELICREERGGGRGIAKKNRRRIPLHSALACDPSGGGL